MKKSLCLIFLIVLPLTVFSYTVSGNTLIPTKDILSYIKFNPVNDIKILYLSRGYPYVKVEINNTSIIIIEQKLSSVEANKILKNSLISIIGSYPRVLNMKDIQNISLFLSKLKIKFHILNEGNSLTLVVNKKINNIYYNDKLIFIDNLYDFLLDNQSDDCKITFKFVWKGNNLYIYKNFKYIKVDFLGLYSYDMKDCKDEIHREMNLDLRNGWNPVFDSKNLNVKGDIMDYSFSGLSLHLKYFYINLDLFSLLLNNSSLLTLGIICPYLGFHIDSNKNYGFYLNDYKNIFCGIFNNGFKLLFNYDNITFGYINAFYLGFRHKSYSYMLGYGNNKISFMIFDWRQ